MKAIYYIFMMLIYLESFILVLWTIGYVVYYFIKLRKYEDFDAMIYFIVTISLLLVIMISFTVTYMAQTPAF